MWLKPPESAVQDRHKNLDWILPYDHIDLIKFLFYFIKYIYTYI